MSAFRTFRRLLRYAGPRRSALVGGAFAAVINAAGAAAYAYLVGPLLRTLLVGADPSRVETFPLRELPLALLAVAVVKGLSNLACTACMLSASQGTLQALRQDLFGHLLRLPPRFYADHHTGELFSRLTHDVTQVELSVGQALTSYVKDTLQLVALLGVCAWLDLRLFAVAFLLLPLAALPVSRFARRVRQTARGTQASLGALTTLLAEQLHNLTIVQAFRGEDRARARYAELEQAHLAGMQRSLWIRGAFTPVLELLGIGGLALAVIVGAREVSVDPSLAQKLLSFFSAALLLYPPLKAISGTWALTLQGTAAAERLFELRDAPVPPEGVTVATPLTERLVFEDVWVHYPDGRAGLQGARFEVPAGRQVALVGPSGAGKSTALAVLLGLVEPSRGGVRWDGAPLASFTRASRRAQLGWLPQEPTLLSGSVRENLLLARRDATEPAIWEALRRAHADTFVRTLPAGLDQPVGERGAQLSGGQRQRIALARAFLREPSLLLLDEPTRALDAMSEQEVQAGVEELRRGRTALIVAHRLATVEHADWILVLEEGRVTEQGTPSELRAREGRYAALLRAGTLELG